ncbi:restriction endonuclease subunit S [Segatella sp.]|uniref:restriction endonuclease subunit S n=1 Tax=Segatella sp. TaxID=2974253 RepID=UPI003AAF9D77
MMEPKIRFKGFEGEWKTSTIGEIAPLQRGYDLPTNNVISGTIPVVYSNGILRFHNEGKCQAPAIITGRSGTIGKFTYIDHGEYWPHNTSLWVTTFHKNYPRFVYYFFQNVGFEKYATGSGVPTLNRNDIHKHIESIPSNKEEQQAIASYFTTLDSQISASTSRLASLKQMKAASLQAMFPQEGETVPKIRFKGFEGEWKTCVLSSIATMHARIGWQNLRKDEFLSSGDYYLITGTDFHDGKISFETCHYIDKERYNQDKNIQLETDSILITKDGTLGKVAFVDSLNKPATLNAGVFNVRTKDKEIYPKYLFQYLKAPYLMDYVNKNATGGTIKHLNQNMLVNFPVQHPSYKEQVMIGDYLFNLDRQISLQSQRLEKLKQIKSACLDKMFV